MKITSVVGRYSGNVGFTDDTNGMFHSEVEMKNAAVQTYVVMTEEEEYTVTLGPGDLSWSIDQDESQLTCCRIANNAMFGEIFKSVEEGILWPVCGDGKEINDFTARLMFRFTFDNNATCGLEYVYEDKAWREAHNDIPEDYTFDFINVQNWIAALIKTFQILGGTASWY